LDAALAPLAREDFAGWSADDIAALYWRLETELIRQWRAPLVNDFFAMIAFGVLGRLAERWLPDLPPTIINDLLCGEGGIISTEPARRVQALAARVPESPELAAAFAREGDDRGLWDLVRSDARFDWFRAELEEYLERFGDRCGGELKLETVTFREDPSLLLGFVRAHAGREAPARREGPSEQEIRALAEREAASRLPGLRRKVFMGVVRETRRRIRDRENLRFERTRVFGLVRRLFLALGARLAESGALSTPRDVFYLTKEEVFGYLEGTGVTADLGRLAAQRREEFSRYEREPAPPDRFETTGAPDPNVECQMSNVKSGSAAAQEVWPALRGTGCCPGVVGGRVKIVRDPLAAGDLSGRIMAAERTDPGWTVLFPLAAGLLVQRGSLLSHSAIVARETGLPCIIAIPGLLETLRDGEWVEMDGATGEVRRLEGHD
jgi:pyruvate,water dikinase